MNFSDRKYVIIGVIILTGLIFTIRLLYMQVLDDRWSNRAQNITERKIITYPSRGLIYDRNGEILVSNKAVYELLVIPAELKGFDTTSFCDLLKIDTSYFNKTVRGLIKRKFIKTPGVFMKQIPFEEYSKLAVHLHRFPGIYVQTRTLRSYPDSTACHLLGYIREVDGGMIKKDPYYKSGDYIGISGVEKSYEKELRGSRGAKFILKDVLNKEVGSSHDGNLDTLPKSGENLYATIASDLQKFGEKMMANKKGSIVAIEPSTGEILCMVSGPGYDPNLLVGRNFSSNYGVLKKDTLSPLFNRAIRARYRPGSIFKMIQALVALEEGVISPQTRIRCNRNIIGCHGAHSNDDLEGAIQHSCNPYFYNVLKRMVQPGVHQSIFKDSPEGLNNWRKHILSFGLGPKFNTDIPFLVNGFIPDSKFYDKYYGQYRWAYTTIYSIAIGEGELLVTPLQMANLAAIIANNGHYYTPHFIRQIGDDNERVNAFEKKNHTTVSPYHFDIVANAMQKVVESPTGTARRARIPNIEVCGKTGTVQNGELEDHSVFMAFAPKENPQIAIAVYTEYAGSGGTWSAPIASLMIEKYLNDTIANPKKLQRILDAEFLVPQLDE